MLSNVTGISPGGLKELSDDDLEVVSGGSQKYIRCVAICSTYGWRSRVGSPDFAYDSGIEHIESSSRCLNFQIAAI